MIKLFLILFLIIKSGFCQEFTSIGDAIEGFAPCEDRSVLFMERIIGGPPKSENYWDGTFYLDKWPQLREVHISLTVDSPATIELNEDDGRVLTTNRTFHISTFSAPPTINHVKFKVKGRPFGAFPNVEKIVLNGVDICKNPTKWKPSILGSSGNIGQTDELIPEKSKCGRRLVNHKGLITNGFPSEEGDWPWHAAIYHINKRQNEYKCGGTLINSNLILTASHCVFENGHPIIPNRVLVQLGKHNLIVSGIHTQEFQVYEIVIHENYNPSDLSNDIALLKLATEVIFTNYIQPVCLWSKNKIPLSNVIDRNGIVIGWGFTENNKLSDILSQGRMPVVSVTDCLLSNRAFFGQYLSEKNFCAGFKNGTSVCNGDSGGGMIFEDDGIYSIRGIVSLSVAQSNERVCNPNEYVIFTDVAKYLDWIENHSDDPLAEDDNNNDKIKYLT